MTRPIIALAVAALIVAGGCSVSAQGRAQVHDDDSVPFGLLDPDAPPILEPTIAEGSQTVTLCFISDDQLSFVERRIDTPVELEDAVDALSVPPTDTGAQLRTAITDVALVRRVRLSAGIAQVDLRDAISELGTEDQVLAFAQIVCTLTAQPGVGQVSFTLEGRPTDIPDGDGALVRRPVSRDDYRSLFP